MRIDPPNVGDVWPVWRVVARGMASLRDVDEHWSVEDVLDANEYLDVRDDLDAPRANPPATG